jgi:E3 ubiquitin-protein ligase HUWE1
MSRASDKSKGQDNAKAIEDDYSDASSDETVSELNDAEREPATDLYRNSALGMFGGVCSFSAAAAVFANLYSQEMADEYGDEDMDDEEDEDDEDVEMDFGEESDGTSEESDVGIEDEEGLDEEDSGEEDEGEWDDDDDDGQGRLVEEEVDPIADADEDQGDEDEDDEGAWEVGSCSFLSESIEYEVDYCLLAGP